MQGIEILLLLASLTMLVRVWRRYIRDRSTIRQSLWWTALWLLGGFVVLVPESVNRAADFLGVGRGADVVLYAAVVLLFVLNFKLFSKLVKIENDIIRIVREFALRDKNDERPKTE